MYTLLLASVIEWSSFSDNTLKMLINTQATEIQNKIHSRVVFDLFTEIPEL